MPSLLYVYLSLYVRNKQKMFIAQVFLTEFKSLPPLFEETPNAVHELTLASKIRFTLYCVWFFLLVVGLVWCFSGMQMEVEKSEFFSWKLQIPSLYSHFVLKVEEKCLLVSHTLYNVSL